MPGTLILPRLRCESACALGDAAYRARGPESRAARRVASKKAPTVRRWASRMSLRLKYSTVRNRIPLALMQGGGRELWKPDSKGMDEAFDGSRYRCVDKQALECGGGGDERVLVLGGL